MRIIAKRSLIQFWMQSGREDAKAALEAWHDEVVKAIWLTPHDIKQHMRSASICGNNRVVFNIAGNKYRLIAEIQYQAGIVWVKFIGSHAEYDKINAETVNAY